MHIQPTHKIPYNSHDGQVSKLVFFQMGESNIISRYSSIHHTLCLDLTILKRTMDFELKYQRTIWIIEISLTKWISVLVEITQSIF